jgi:hypothetical protein
MAEKKSLVEETLLQMKSLEDVISENAKGILHSTMKEEIGELVKESLYETEMESEMYEEPEDEIQEQMDDESDDMEDMDDEFGDMDDESGDMDDESGDMDDESGDMDDESEDMEDMEEPKFDDEEPIDLTNASDEEILKVFKGMGEEDGIIVKKDGNTVDLEDTNENSHYKISLGEQYDDEEEDMMSDEDFKMLSDDSEMFEQDSFDSMDSDMTEDDEEVMFEIEMSDDMDDEDEDEFEIDMDDKDKDEFEIYMDDDFGGFEEIGNDFKENEEWSEGMVGEGFKAKGVGMGKAKFQYKKTKGGFKESMKQGTKGVGMGKPKFEFKESMKSVKPKGMGMGKAKFEYKEQADDAPLVNKTAEMRSKTSGGTKPMSGKTETKEASRTLGTGRRFGKHGLPKPKAAPRHLNAESVNSELNLLREKNEEYRRALNVFRSKLNEVAVFNSNLAYATRLFTEHSTTKQEKINILRRFDSVESLKESKTLYKTVKDELSSQNGNKLVKESIQEKIERTPSSGSAANLIESKTYENPQFMRMKDLMSKMNIIK